MQGIQDVAAVSGGYGHTCALRALEEAPDEEVGTVECWGWRSRGQLGHGDMTVVPTPVDVLGLP